jgi:hypothetical protein
VTTLEIVRLRVLPENAEAFAAARGPMLAELSARPGFVRADLARLADDEWLDLVAWRSPEDFAESRRRGADGPGVAAFFGLIDGLVADESGELVA